MAVRVVAMSTPSKKPSSSSGSSSWKRRLRRLQTRARRLRRPQPDQPGCGGRRRLLITDRQPDRTSAVGALAGLAALIGILVRRWSDFYPKPKTGLLGYFVSVRLLLLVAVGGVFLHARPDAGTAEVAAAWVALGILLLLVMAEPLVKTLSGTTKVIVRNLPGVPPVPKARFSPGWITAGNVLAIVLTAVLAAVGAPGWTLLVPALATVPLTMLTVRHALRAPGRASGSSGTPRRPCVRTRRPSSSTTRQSREPGYQLGMWLPYLERLNKPYVVITRNPATVAEIARIDRQAHPGAAHRQEDVGPPGLDGGAVDEGRLLRPGQPGQLDLPALPDDPRLAQPRRLRQAGQLPPAARDLQQAVRLRAAGR